MLNFISHHRIGRNDKKAPNYFSWIFWTVVLMFAFGLDLLIIKLATTLITADLCEIQSLSNDTKKSYEFNNVFVACYIGKWLAYLLTYISSMIGITHMH